MQVFLFSLQKRLTVDRFFYLLFFFCLCHLSIYNHDSMMFPFSLWGTLKSLQYKKKEYMHNPAHPWWGHSAIEMFPVIWSTSAQDYKVETPRGIWYLDQHGFVRDCEYTYVYHETDSAVFRLDYTADTQIKNSKYPHRSSLEYLSWPYNVCLTKTYTVTENWLEISFLIECEDDMPYMFGYHPAFVLSWNQTEIINNIPLTDIMKTWDDSYVFEKTKKMTLTYEDGQCLEMSHDWFWHTVAWCPIGTMLCLEPVTWYAWWDERVWEKGSREFGVKIWFN